VALREGFPAVPPYMASVRTLSAIASTS
jgi:hypothetical protein